MLLTVCLRFCLKLVIVLKANTKKHVEDLVKDRDSWKTNCIKIWKGVAPVLDLISLELPRTSTAHQGGPRSKRHSKRGAGSNSS